ncbi:MAG: SusD/RagB family nutrient-binding outer membrane lipoprotein [Chitinophagaceae bacterium]
MKKIKNIFLVFTGALMVLSCNKQIQEKQTDPNNPTTVPPSLVLGTVLYDISGSGSAGSLGNVNSWSNVHSWNQYHCQNYDYYGNNIYGWTNGSFDPYLVMKNVVQMEKEATNRGAAVVNPYEAVGRFVRAYYYYNLTSLFGDVPEAQALQTGNNNPAYTSQEQVFLYVLNQLDTANTHFTTLIAANDNSLSSSQDLFYQGNLTKWQKLVNSFKLRVLISLSNKTSDALLGVATQFSTIINNPAKYPIFAGPGDDLAFVYNPGGANTYSTYPFNINNYGSIAARYNMAATYVSALTTLNDPRVFITTEPAWALAKTDPDPCKFNYFAGASSGESLSTMYGNANAGVYSFINRYRYYSNFTGEPNVLSGYKEMCFNIAEAIMRGWVTGKIQTDAETWYKAGIGASMAFYGIDITKTSFTARFLPPGNSSVTQVVSYPFTFNYTNYYAQTSVKLSATAATAVSQIVLQKYIACFENSGYEGYFNYRRTGVPAFQAGPGTGNNSVIPKRYTYPVSEQTQNKANYSAALSAQQFAADDLNQTMWLLK